MFLKWAFMLLASTIALSANGQSPTGVSQQALEKLTYFAHEIDTNADLQNSIQNIIPLTPEENLPNTKKREHYANYIEVFGPDPRAIENLRKLSKAPEHIYYLNFAEQYMLFNKLKSLDVTSESYLENLDALRVYQVSDNWREANRALYLEASLQINSDQHELALQKANAAIMLLPDSLDQDVSKAFLDTNEAVIAIYLYTANLELAAPALERQLVRAKSLDNPYDGISHLNNIVFALMKWREFETANEIAEISYRLSQNSTQQKRVTSAYRYAQTLNALGQYPDADRVARDGLTIAEPGIWNIHLTSQRAIALAGFGSYSEAQNLLKKVQTDLKDFPELEPRFALRLTQVQALLARSDADAREVFEIMDEAMTIQTRMLLQQSSEETQKLMGTLDNEKSLQAAQEAKVQAERNLAIERAEAEARRSRYLTIILAISLLALISAIAFGIHQTKAAKNLAKLRDMAASGEQAKSRFLAVMSHELRTPLNGIIGLAEMLSRDGPSKDVQFKGGVIYKSGLSLLDLLSNILDMSQIEAGKIHIYQSATDMRDLMINLEELWQHRANKKGLSFSVTVDDNVPSLLTLDAVRARQCLENLISNAIKFTATGQVDVSMSYGTSSRKKKIKSDHDGFVKIIIRDSGKGLSEEEQGSVFKPFTQADNSTTREFGGSGLGLAITRHLAILMGGDVSVISNVDEGAQFTLTLAATPSQEQKPDDTPLIASTKETLLRVEHGIDDAVDTALKQPKLAPVAPLQARTHVAPPAPIPQAPVQIEQGADSKAPPQLIEPDDLSPILIPATSPPVKTAERAQQDRLAHKPTDLSRIFSDMLNEIDTASTHKQANAAVSGLKPAQPIALSPETQDPVKGLKVLVVDDIAANHEVLKIFLQPAGCSVVTALNGREAVQAASCEKFDLIMMDVRMPEMDGIEATQIIKREHAANSDTPIIAMTADISAQNNAQCMAAGANVFLTKPVVASELFGAIRYVLGTKAPALRKSDFA